MILLISVLQGRREAFELAMGWGSSGSRRRMRERDEHEMNLSSFVTILMSKYLSFTCGNERVFSASNVIEGFSCVTEDLDRQ
ncbi:hypothetical protein MTR_3g015873 [Medicago truncatula]|uniref:Uncharacterized protein n=1 Tax=Medicago truncatula TaxID=3880 RepID=A0A072UUJ0_MEDTR|nr:hypothetical protein MTR_3g015873 [Medicago truncatula]